MTKVLASVLALPFALSAFAAETGVVHHPAPKDPLFISAGLYEAFKKTLPPVPTRHSTEQKEDEQELLKRQRERTARDCEAARQEVFVSLQSMYGQPAGPLDEPSVTRLAPFFEQVRNDADFFIQKMKVDFPRQRPFLYLSKIEPCVPKEVTGAYPSGHAALSKLYAMILNDLFPDSQRKFEDRAIEIGKHRVLSGMHHPSDVAAGRALAEKIYAELKKSRKFQEAFLKVSRP